MVVIMRAEDGPAGVLFLTLLEVICNFTAFSSTFLSGFFFFFFFSFNALPLPYLFSVSPSLTFIFFFTLFGHALHTLIVRSYV